MTTKTEQVTYYTIRPTFEAGDSTAPAFIHDFEEVQIQEGYASAPPMADSWTDSVFDALEMLLQKKAENPALRLWYNGNELCFEFTDYVSFADGLSENYDGFEVVEKVANGTLPADDQAVEDAIDYDESDLIGRLIEKVDPTGSYVFTPAADEDEDDQDEAA